MRKLVGGCVVAMTATLSLQAQAFWHEESPWTVRLGVTEIAPKPDNGTLAVGSVDVKSKLGMSFNLDYRMSPYLSVDLLGVIPYVQHIKLNGTDVGSTKHLPPTLTLQFHPLHEGRFDPYAGVGVNRTFFFSEHLVDGTRLQLSNTWGVAAQIGIDAKLSRSWLVGIDARYIQIEPDASANGTPIGTVKINPFVYSANIGYRF